MIYNSVKQCKVYNIPEFSPRAWHGLAMPGPMPGSRHAAGIIDFVELKSQTAERMGKVFKPKAGPSDFWAKWKKGRREICKTCIYLEYLSIIFIYNIYL